MEVHTFLVLVLLEEHHCERADVSIAVFCSRVNFVFQSVKSELK